MRKVNLHITAALGLREPDNGCTDTTCSRRTVYWRLSLCVCVCVCVCVYVCVCVCICGRYNPLQTLAVLSGLSCQRKERVCEEWLRMKTSLRTTQNNGRCPKHSLSNDSSATYKIMAWNVQLSGQNMLTLYLPVLRERLKMSEEYCQVLRSLYPPHSYPLSHLLWMWLGQLPH